MTSTLLDVFCIWFVCFCHKLNTAFIVKKYRSNTLLLCLTGKYGDDLTETSESVKHLWAVLTQLTSDERSRFLRFVTGRKRPPAPFTVAKAGGDKDSLPHASTCASTLFLPDYSCVTVAKEKLRSGTIQYIVLRASSLSVILSSVTLFK